MKFRTPPKITCYTVDPMVACAQPDCCSLLSIIQELFTIPSITVKPEMLAAQIASVLCIMAKFGVL